MFACATSHGEWAKINKLKEKHGLISIVGQTAPCVCGYKQPLLGYLKYGLFLRTVKSCFAWEGNSYYFTGYFDFPFPPKINVDRLSLMFDLGIGRVSIYPPIQQSSVHSADFGPRLVGLKQWSGNFTKKHIYRLLDLFW